MFTNVLRSIGAVVAILGSIGPTLAQDDAKNDLVFPVGCLLSGQCWGKPVFSPEFADGNIVSPEELIGTPISGGIQLRYSDITISADVQSDADRIFGKAVLALRSVADYMLNEEQALSDAQRQEIDEHTDVMPDPPAAVVEAVNEYAGSDAFFECQAAVDAILARWGGESELTSVAEISLAAALYRIYQTKCLKPAFAALSPALPHLVTLFDEKPSGATVHCMGFNFASNLILTAKHCLIEFNVLDDFIMDYGAENTDQFVTNVRVPRRVKALVARTPYVVEVRIPELDEFEQDLRYNPNLPHTDLVVLIADALPPRDDQETFVGAHIWDSLVVPSNQGDLTIASEMAASGDGQQLMQFLSSTILTDSSGVCYAATADGSCIYSTCQTAAGVSGAPVFIKRDGDVHLAGVHAGATSPERPICDFRRSSFYPNYAIDLRGVSLTKDELKITAK